MNAYVTKLQYDSKTKEELIENCEIANTTALDVYEIVRILAQTFEFDGVGLPPHRVMNLMEEELRQSHADIGHSVKIYDKRDGKIYGLLIFSHFTMAQGSPLLTNRNTAMIAEYLMGFKQINGFAFIIDKRLRGLKFDEKMIQHSKDFLMGFDFVWCATDVDSKSNAYWQRLGFLEIWRDEDAVYYIRNMSKKSMNDIFILKLISDAKKREDENNSKHERGEDIDGEYS